MFFKDDMAPTWPSAETSIAVAVDVTGSSSASRSTSEASQSSSFVSASMTSVSRYTLPLQAFPDVLAGTPVGELVEPPRHALLAYHEAGAVAQRLRPRTEYAALDELVEPPGRLGGERDRNRVTIAGPYVVYV